MRTEAEILKDFEKLGYKVEDGKKYSYCLFKRKNDRIIYFDLEDKTYCKYHLTEYTASDGYFDSEYESEIITLKEHKLIHELMQVWGWL